MKLRVCTVSELKCINRILLTITALHPKVTWSQYNMKLSILVYLG